MTSKPHFLNMLRNGFAETLLARGEKPFRYEQVRKWIFEGRVDHPDAMTNVSKSLRQILGEELDFTLPKIVHRLDSADGSTKLLLHTDTGLTIETVILRYEGRVSLCVSSQVGCRLACSFCQTGKLGFFRNLTAGQILAQYFLAQKICEEEDGRRISHVVFMGMGEPLDNYDAVVDAVNTLTSPLGFGLSSRHVTVSTSGIAPKIISLASDVKASLAISLHAANDELRTALMPINRRYPLSELKASLKQYQELTGQKLTIEYILLKDTNVEQKHAKELVRFLHGLRAKVNLIPFNDHPGSDYQRPDDASIRAFQSYLAARSIPAPVRYSKGLDVSAACGQLAAKEAADLSLRPDRSRIKRTLEAAVCP